MEVFNSWCNSNQWTPKPHSWHTFWELFIKFPEFRRLIDYRIKNNGKKWSKLLRLITYGTSFYHNLYLTAYDGIGGGLFLHHAFATIVSCQRMGRNCKIYQQVTIGWNDKGCPTIGDNVIISCGAKVLGDVEVGDDVIIGANAVVVNDVPCHSVVFGVPARIIKRRDNFNEEWRSI